MGVGGDGNISHTPQPSYLAWSHTIIKLSLLFLPVLTFIGNVTCAKHYSNLFSWINSFKPCDHHGDRFFLFSFVATPPQGIWSSWARGQIWATVVTWWRWVLNALCQVRTEPAPRHCRDAANLVAPQQELQREIILWPPLFLKWRDREARRTPQINQSPGARGVPSPPSDPMCYLSNTKWDSGPRLTEPTTHVCKKMPAQQPPPKQFLLAPSYNKTVPMARTHEEEKIDFVISLRGHLIPAG